VSVAGQVPPSLRHALQSAAGSVPLIIRTVSHSEAALEAMTERIAGDQPALAGQAIELSAWGPDYVSNKVLVHLVRYSSQVRARLLSCSVQFQPSGAARRSCGMIANSMWMSMIMFSLPLRARA
jgi:hypothetical protein